LARSGAGVLLAPAAALPAARPHRPKTHVRQHSAAGSGESMPRLPKLSISAKLYIIFSLVAASVLGLAACAVLTSQQQASLAEKVGRYFSGALNVERIDGLIYAVVMESRGIYMTPRSEMPTVKNYATGLLAFNDQIGRVVEDWRGTLDPDDVAAFEAFAARIRQFQDFRRELVRRALEIGPEAGREWGDNDANRSVRKALNKDIEQLGKLYDARSKKTYAELNSAARTSALILIALAVGALGSSGRHCDLAGHSAAPSEDHASDRGRRARGRIDRGSVLEP
jgi:methyl-accepting chemotaxis protein